MSNEMKRYVLELMEITITGNDYYTFDFKTEEDIPFKEGQYGVFMHVDKEIDGRKVRAFSIANSRQEKLLKISTKIIENPSDFKVKMRDLSVGDTMTFDGPMGSFTLEEDYHSVFIAGGIGITPIRGIVKQLEYLKLDKEAMLIHSEPRGLYPFKEEFDKLDFLEKHYVSSVEDTKKAIDELSLKYFDKAFYYISGSPGFVNAIKDQLVYNNVSKSNIKFDRFSGY